MSVLSVVLVCVAGLHLATAAFAAMHHARSPRGTEFLPLSGICFSQAVAAIGNAIVTEAPHFSIALFGQQLQLLGATFALASFSALATRRTDTATTRAAQIIQMWAVIMVLAVLFGLCFHAEARTPRTFGFDWAPDYREARFSPVGLTLVWIIFPVAMFALRQVNRAPGAKVETPEFWVAAVLCTAAFVNDTLVRFGPLRSIYINDIVTLFLALNANRRLSQHFRATTDELLVRTAELELSTLELDQMHAQIMRRQQLAAVGEFSAVIAHEVRNPLAIIKNAVSALRRTDGHQHQPELLSILDEEATRLQRLVSDLSTYTRPLVPTFAPTRLEPLVQQVITRMRTATEALSRLTLNVVIEDGAGELSCDAALVEMALANVLANAAQATADGGTITIEGRRGHASAKWIDLLVRDTGSGMSPEVAAKAAEPFFTTRSTGTGLGLAIVVRVMRAHSGEVAIESNATGTSITLRFRAVTAQG